MITWYVVYQGYRTEECADWYGSTPDRVKALGWFADLQAKGIACWIEEVLAPSEGE